VKDVRTIITAVDPTHLYLPTGSSQGRPWGDILFRIRPDPAHRDKTLAAVQSAIASVDPSLLPALDVTSLEDGPVALQRGFFRVVAILPAVLTLLALTLASAGIYGVMAFLVSQRTREIGIRMAMGATSPVVVCSFLIQGLRPVFAGILTGLAASIPVLAFIRAKGSLPPGYGDSMRLAARLSDPLAYAELALVLFIAVLASVIPARRALRVDPVVALRHE
jgi:putative ABC transport system permease protein